MRINKYNQASKKVYNIYEGITVAIKFNIIIFVFVFVAVIAIYYSKSALSGSKLATDSTKFIVNEHIDGFIVLELFTSQSCSSCPPADEALASLEKDANIIALSCHVDYWNYLSWRDTQSQAFCTQRQRQYSNQQNRNGRIFTPELQVNGVISAVGSRPSEVNTALKNISSKPALPIKLSLSDKGKQVGIEMPDITASNNIHLIAFSYTSKVTQSIKAGENRGRNVTYTNSVQSFTDFGLWNGQKNISDVLSENDIPQNGGVVIIAQNINRRLSSEKFIRELNRSSIFHKFPFMISYLQLKVASDHYL